LALKTSKAQNDQSVPTVWIDPIGCDRWIIDDGVEGYLSQRLDK